MDVFEAVVRDARPFLRRAALHAARTLGVFDALARPCTPAALARRVGVRPARLQALLDVLALEGHLGRDRNRLFVRAAPAAEPPPPAGWGRLAEVLRADRPLDPTPDEPSRRAYHEHLARVGAGPAAQLARLVRPRGLRVLDAGGGAGAYAQAFLDAGAAEVAIADEPAVLALARERLGEERVRCVAADLRTARLPTGFDAVLLVNVLHLHGPRDAARIVRRCAAALSPGGRLVVKDLAIAPDRSGPPVAVYFALNMALYTPAGTVHPARDVRAWLRDAGLARPVASTLPASPDCAVLVASRPRS